MTAIATDTDAALAVGAFDPDPDPDSGRPPSPVRALMRSPLMIIGVTLIILLALVGVFAPWLAPYDPKVTTSPLPLEMPSAEHWLGTDIPGRDNLSQLIYGARTSFVVAIGASSLALLLGILVGVLPALLGGKADTVSNRFVVFMLALPGFPLLILVAALAGTSQLAILVIIAVGGIWPIARILRSQALILRDAGYITASRGFGAGRLYVLRRHMVPGLGPHLVVRWVEMASVAVALEAGLAVIGLGNPSTVSWGQMINRATAQPGIYFSSLWPYWALPPGFAVLLTILGFMFVGMALEPMFNPRWRRSK
ncbi:MAG: ABC transporter permease [Acidimicrobiales bacterium]